MQPIYQTDRNCGMHAHRTPDHASNVYASMPPPPCPGTIPPELGGLTALHRLDLEGNQLTGER